MEQQESSPELPSIPALHTIATSLGVDQKTVLDAAGIDIEFLLALPDDMRNEVVLQQVQGMDFSHLRRPDAAASPAVAAAAGTDIGQIPQEFLDALPADLRAEVMREQGSPPMQPSPEPAAGAPA